LLFKQLTILYDRLQLQYQFIIDYKIQSQVRAKKLTFVIYRNLNLIPDFKSFGTELPNHCLFIYPLKQARA